MGGGAGRREGGASRAAGGNLFSFPDWLQIDLCLPQRRVAMLTDPRRFRDLYLASSASLNASFLGCFLFSAILVPTGDRVVR